MPEPKNMPKLMDQSLNPNNIEHLFFKVMTRWQKINAVATKAQRQIPNWSMTETLGVIKAVLPQELSVILEDQVSSFPIPSLDKRDRDSGLFPALDGDIQSCSVIGVIEIDDVPGPGARSKRRVLANGVKGLASRPKEQEEQGNKKQGDQKPKSPSQHLAKLPSGASPTAPFSLRSPRGC